MHSNKWGNQGERGLCWRSSFSFCVFLKKEQFTSRNTLCMRKSGDIFFCPLQHNLSLQTTDPQLVTHLFPESKPHRDPTPSNQSGSSSFVLCMYTIHWKQPLAWATCIGILPFLLAGGCIHTHIHQTQTYLILLYPPTPHPTPFRKICLCSQPHQRR